MALRWTVREGAEKKKKKKVEKKRESRKDLLITFQEFMNGTVSRAEGKGKEQKGRKEV